MQIAITKYFRSSYLYAGLLLGLIIGLLFEYLVFVAAGLICLFVLKELNRKFLLPFSIFLLLSFGSDVGESVRDIMNMFSLGLIIFLVFEFKQDLTYRIKLIPRGIIYLVITVIASMFLSSAFSVYPATGFSELTRQVVFFFLCFLIFLLYDPDNDLNIFIYAVILSGFAVSITTIYSFLSSPEDISQLLLQAYVKEGGIFKNITATGGLLMVSTGLTIVNLVVKKRSNSAIPFGDIGILAVQIIGFLLTNSRAAFMGLTFAAMLMFFIFNRKFFYKVTVALISLLAGLTVFSETFSDTIFNFLRLGRVLENTRYIIWDMLFRMIQDNPVLGIGPGETKYFLNKYINVMWGSWDAEQLLYNFEKGGLGQAHNFYLFRWVELGIVGLATAVLLPALYLFYTSKIRKWLRQTDPKQWILFTGLMCVGIGIFFRAFFEATGILSHGWISRDLPFWILMIIVLAEYSALKIKEEIKI